MKAIAAAAAIVVFLPAAAQTVSGTAYEDRNGNGVRDGGEPAVPGIGVELFGVRDVGGAFDSTVPSAADGTFSFSPGNGCYLVRPTDPPGWRMSYPRQTLVPEGTAGYAYPVGLSRFGKLDGGIDRLKAGSLRHTAMGDSIAWNFNICGYPEQFWYAKQVRARIACAAPSATVTLDSAAVKGEHTDDLLVDETNDMNNVFRVIDAQPQLVTISMIGNDLLNVDPAAASPTQAQINTAVAEVLDSRQNLQEALSSLTSEIPGVDIALNSLYDNLAYNCNSGNTSTFHRTWLPIVNRILRELAWGQTRRASVTEAAPEFAQEDQNGVCDGFDAMICRDLFGLDDIHPNNNGYNLMREKAWEAVGGVNLGTKDVNGRTSMTTDFGYLRRVRRLYPTTTQTLSGASATNPSAALTDEDAGAATSITLGTGAQEFRLAGFPTYYDEDVIVKVIAGVRYRTTGTVTDDFYRMEASPTGQFRPGAGHAYAPTDWNFYTPIVGGGGPNQPPENPDYGTEKLLVRPNVASYREVSATLTKNPTLAGGAGEYSWPAITRGDLATTAMRVVAAPVAGTPGDAYQVELDAAWLDLYGWQKARPAEVSGVTASRLSDGTLEVAFDPVPSAQRYDLYTGRLDTLRAGSYDHGAGAPAGPACASPTADAGGGRWKISVPVANQPGVDAYFLVTAHVDDVESPAGTATGGAEIDRSQSVCE